MPIKRVDSAYSINTHKRRSAKLFKKTNNLQQECYITGNNILKDAKISPITKFIFSAMDKTNSRLTSHKKVCRLLIYMCEKIIKNTGNI